MVKIKKEEVLFVVALENEAGVKFKDFDLLYTGVGKVNATYSLTKELYVRKMRNTLPKYVINFGSCGSRKFKKGELVACNKFIQRDMMTSNSNSTEEFGKTPRDRVPMIIEHKKIIEDLKYAICGTGDNFATEQSPLEEVEVYDMEAYALAKVCYLENIDFISIKYVTDGINENGNEDWEKEVLSSPDSFYSYINNRLLSI